MHFPGQCRDNDNLYCDHSYIEMAKSPETGMTGARQRLTRQQRECNVVLFCLRVTDDLHLSCLCLKVCLYSY